MSPAVPCLDRYLSAPFSATLPRHRNLVGGRQLSERPYLPFVCSGRPHLFGQGSAARY